MRKKRPYSESYSVIRSLLRTSPYSVRMWENPDKNNSEYWHFLHSIPEKIRRFFQKIFWKKLWTTASPRQSDQMYVLNNMKRVYQCYFKGKFDVRMRIIR